MKHLKVLLFAGVIFILTGCSVEYNLTINDDSSVNEKVVASEITNRMKVNTGMDENKSVSYLYKMFNRKGLKTRISTIKKDGYTISTVSGYYDSIKKYASNFSSDIVESVDYSKDGNIVTLTFNQTKKLSSTSSKSLIYDDIKVNIYTPYKVLDNNAESVRGNTYTWTIKKDEDLKKMELVFDTSSIKTIKKITIGKKTFNLRIEFLAVGIILLIAIIIALIVFINNRKNNRL